MYDIITFGSGTRDIYLISDDFLIVGEKKFITQKGLRLSLGSKIEIKNILFRTGGGGTNSAIVFRNQGFETAWCGMVGDDEAGREIIKELKKKKVETKFIFQTKEKPTNLSVILTAAGKERTILVYRGASGFLSKKQIPFNELKAKWFYLAPLSGNLCSVFEYLVDFAERNNIKIAINPGNSQLSLPKSRLKRIFQKIDILILNQEEASLVTDIPYYKEQEIFQRLDEWVKGIAVMTKGPGGAIVSDGKYLYRVSAPKVRVVDRTGAGDSFGAGFLSGYIKKGDITFGLQLAMANSISNLKQWGAKEGLLRRGEKWQKVKVEKIKI